MQIVSDEWKMREEKKTTKRRNAKKPLRIQMRQAERHAKCARLEPIEITEKKHDD